MARNPDRMLTLIRRVRTSLEMIGEDLENPKVWSRPALPEDFSVTVHHGGGRNIAGDPVGVVGTLRQKIAIVIGRVSYVLTGWKRYHKSRGMSTVAYCDWASVLLGRYGRLRGHRHNGGQWGIQNTVTRAFVFVHGFGQHIYRRGWLALGLFWFCAGDPEIKGHCDWNDHPASKSRTSCPSETTMEGIRAEKHIKALGTLRWPKRFPALRSRGIRVRAATLRLKDLGYLPGMTSQYTRNVRMAVLRWQLASGRRPTGKVGLDDWKALA